MDERRRTRAEAERLEMMVTVARRTTASVAQVLALCVGLAAAGGAALAVPFAGEDARWLYFGAGLAGLCALVLVLGIGYDLLRTALVDRRRPTADGDRLLQTREEPGHRQWRVLPEGWTRPQYVAFLRAVRGGSVSFSQRGAAEYGHDDEAFKALLRWLVDRGLYETRNEGRYDNQNGGEWLAAWPAILGLDEAPGPAEGSAPSRV